MEEIFISEKTTILEALKKLDRSAKKTLFVVDDGKLVAALTDGDIRRWILKRGSLEEAVSKISNYQPKYLKLGEEDKASVYMQEYHLEALPIVDDKLVIKEIRFQFGGKSTSLDKIKMPVVIMAGGKGTRLYPYTKILPKPLIPIGDIPISEHIVNRFHEHGCDDFIFIVNYKKNMIKAYFNEVKKDYKVSYVDEEAPLGTGGGLSLLRNQIKETFIFTNCDTIINEDFSEIIKEHKKRKNLVTMICSLRNYQVPYGVVRIGDNGSIESMSEKPQMSFFTNTGTYIVEPEVIDYINDNEEIGFPDVIEKLKNAGKHVGVYPINENSWLDMGQFDTMEQMKAKLHIED